jgi:hypothetical protein
MKERVIEMVNFEVMLAIYNATIGALDNDTKQIYYDYLDKIIEKK